MKSKTPEKPTEWLTTKEALALLKLSSRESLRKYTYNFKIRVSKPLGRVFYSKTDILAIIEDNAVVM